MAAIDRDASSVSAPALTIGVGLGGFVDGIVLHQILGWHHILSARPEFDTRANELADGLFHAGAWLVVLVGVLWLYARLRLPPVPAAWPRLDRGPRPWSALVGWMLTGWGLFNLVEGLVDHHVLGLHHVRPGAHQLAWDLGFLAFGAVLAGVGILMARPHRVPRSNAIDMPSR
jgi:Predicted membrane protein